jgi:hypothetical protein
MKVEHYVMREGLVWTLHQYKLFFYQIREMRWVGCVMVGELRNANETLIEKIKDKYLFGNLSVGGMIIL